MYDSLTGLLDRTTFFSRLNTMTNEAAQQLATLGVLVIDVRRFSRINEKYGFQVGDRVLQQVAEVLKQLMREGELVARIADDQFVWVLERVANIGHAELAAMKLQKLLDKPIQSETATVRCFTSIGIALFPQQAIDAESLLQSATKALYQAKRLDQSIGRFEKEEGASKGTGWDIEAALEESINRAELEVYFQPKIALIDGAPVGAEALVRWRHPERGLLSPAEFLPAAEAIGFMKPLSIWMLNSALRCSSEWTEQWGRLGVSVNMPPFMIMQPDFVDMVMNAEKLWHRENSYLCLEVLEESLVDDMQLAFERLNHLRQNGISISVDDFGTGYSSLSYFRDFPADELKIDKSFVANLQTDEVNRNVVNLIIDMAQLFGLKVVAEGVEDAETLSYLKTHGCDYIQGYHIAKPMPAKDFQQWLLDYNMPS